MLRTIIKKQLLELVDSLTEQQNCLVGKKIVDVISILESCQQAAVVIGETLEKSQGDVKEIVHILEQYCEKIYEVSQKEEISDENIHVLNDILVEIRDRINDLPVRYQIVFMPYNASMWDSMESVWKAFKKDERCECVVMPIPYRKYDANNHKWNDCYELGRFSEYVDVRDYRTFQLAKELPDMAFIHNPYDDWNRVTCVYPQFFSRELKKYVKKLIYIPYYISSGSMSNNQSNLPVYENMDYMIVQSEKFKSCCEEKTYYDKLLPLGSPKADRIVQMCRNGVEIPNEWRRILHGKKSVMLNTSISCFLQYGDVYFDKIKYVFELFKKREDIVLIWRPHPLLESTVRSMKPHLMEKYESLVEYFNSEGIGIWDDTPDVTKTIAIVDAYIGEIGSSVVNLFGVAGKPIFILNNTFYDACSKEMTNKVYLADIERISDKWYCTSNYNGLFEINDDFDIVNMVTQFDKQPRFATTYSSIKAIQDTIYLAPLIANESVSFRTDTQEQKKIFEIDDQFRLKRMAGYGDKIYYLPAGNTGIMVYNFRKKTWTEQKECIQQLKNNVVVSGDATACCSVLGRYLWITAEYTNRVICYDMKNDTYQVCKLGGANYGYTGIVAEKDCVWLAESHTGKILKFDLVAGRLQEYLPPEDFGFWSQETGRRVAYGEMFDMGKYLVAAPAFTDIMLKVDKSTGKMSRMIPEFWEKASEPCNGYHPKINMAACFAKKLNQKQIAVQRASDGALAIVDIDTEQYIVHHPHYTEETMHKLIDGQNGFQKLQTNFSFWCCESRLFSLEGFIDDLVDNRLEDVKRRQIEEASVIAENLDGTCGEKVHEFMMKVLDGE